MEGDIVFDPLGELVLKGNPLFMRLGRLAEARGPVEQHQQAHDGKHHSKASGQRLMFHSLSLLKT